MGANSGTALLRLSITSWARGRGAGRAEGEVRENTLIEPSQASEVTAQDECNQTDLLDWVNISERLGQTWEKTGLLVNLLT